MILSLLLSFSILAVNANDCVDVIKLWKGFGQTTNIDPADPIKCCTNAALNVFCQRTAEGILILPVKILGL